MPKAEEFQEWVCGEVLPSIRKNGYYIDNNNITQEQLDKLQKEKDELEIKLKEANELIDNLRKYGRFGEYYLTREIDKEMDIHEKLDY